MRGWLQSMTHAGHNDPSHMLIVMFFVCACRLQLLEFNHSLKVTTVTYYPESLLAAAARILVGIGKFPKARRKFVIFR